MGLPDQSEFKRRLLAGELDDVIQLLLAEPADFEEESNSAADLPELDSDMAVILERNSRLRQSRLWVASNYKHDQFFAGLAQSKGPLNLTWNGCSDTNDLQQSVALAGAIRWEPAPLLSFAGKLPGTPLDLLFVAPWKPTRRRFSDLVDLQAPPVIPEPTTAATQSSDQVRHTTAMTQALHSKRGQPEAEQPAVPFSVQTDPETKQLLLTTPLRDGEDGIHLVAVAFDNRHTTIQVLDASDAHPDVLKGWVSLPDQYHASKTEAIVTVRDIEPQDVPRLSPFQASLWLAEQSYSILPLTETNAGFKFSVGADELRFLQQFPNALVALRVAPHDGETGA